MNNKNFDMITEEDEMNITGGDLIGDFLEAVARGYRRVYEFSYGVGEAVYDWTH